MEAVLHRPQRGEIAGLREDGRVSGEPSVKHPQNSPINAENQRVNDRRATRKESREPEMKIRQQGGCVDEQKGVFLQLQQPK